MPVRASVSALPEPGHAILRVSELDAMPDGLFSQLPVHPYEARTWGPAAADNLLAEDGWSWRRP